MTGSGRGWSHIIQRLPLKVEGKLITPIQGLDESVMSSVTSGIDNPRNQNPGSYGQFFYYFSLNW